MARMPESRKAGSAAIDWMCSRVHCTVCPANLKSTAQLPLRRRDLIPVQFVQNDVFLGCNPGRLPKNHHVHSPPKHFLIESNRTGQPEIDFQGRTSVNGIELILRPKSPAPGKIG